MGSAAGDDDEDDGGAPRPSKSARKRAAHAAQQLGEALLRLGAAELAALELPEPLSEALRAARRISSRGAALRQRQYIGKLMRAVDAEPIRAALAAQRERAQRAGAYARRVQDWRARLIAQGEPALAELAHAHPHIDRTHWAQLVAAARREHAHGGGGGAARQLFRALRALFATMP